MLIEEIFTTDLAADPKWTATPPLIAADPLGLRAQVPAACDAGAA